jgi:hypothetical protein
LICQSIKKRALHGNFGNDLTRAFNEQNNLAQIAIDFSNQLKNHQLIKHRPAIFFNYRGVELNQAEIIVLEKLDTKYHLHLMTTASYKIKQEAFHHCEQIICNIQNLVIETIDINGVIRGAIDSFINNSFYLVSHENKEYIYDHCILGFVDLRSLLDNICQFKESADKYTEQEIFNNQAIINDFDEFIINISKSFLRDQNSSLQDLLAKSLSKYLYQSFRHLDCIAQSDIDLIWASFHEERLANLDFIINDNPDDKNIDAVVIAIFRQKTIFLSSKTIYKTVMYFRRKIQFMNDSSPDSRQKTLAEIFAPPDLFDSAKEFFSTKLKAGDFSIYLDSQRQHACEIQTAELARAFLGEQNLPILCDLVDQVAGVFNELIRLATAS